jgi:hypothetical protein
VNLFTFNSKVSVWRASRRCQFEIRCHLAFALAFVLAVAAGTLLLSTTKGKRFVSIAAKAVAPRSPDLYLAYFNGGAEDFNIYDGFDDITTNLQKADVLFLGNSRMQYSFRDPRVLDSFFHRRRLNYYILAFGYGEGSTFPEAIIRKYDLRPKWVVINADPFFGVPPTAIAEKVMSTGDFEATKFRFETSASFAVQHYVHMFIPDIDMTPMAGEANWVYFRSKANGTIDLLAFKGKGGPAIAGINALGSTLLPTELAAAKEFQGELQARGCKLALTWIPPSSGNAAKQLSLALNVPLLPPPSFQMMTFDGSHLEWDSSLRFDNILLNELGQVMDARQYGSNEAFKQ